LTHETLPALVTVMGTVPETVAPLSGALICTGPGVAVATGVAVLVALGVMIKIEVAVAVLCAVEVGVAPDALGVGVAAELMNRASTLRVICCAAAFTRDGLSLHGLTSLRPSDHWMLPAANTVAPLGAV
jgi:hypothetical protein